MTQVEVEPTARTLLLATFVVGNSLCALDASAIQEVIRVNSVTPVRHAPDQVAGVMNLRGKVVTLIDLGLILGFGKSVVTRESRVFIVEDRNESIGVLVDSVAEVVEVEVGGEESLPINIPAAQARYFKGVCRAGGNVIALLNTGEVLNESI